MDLELLRSPWSAPSGALAERAFEHHAAAYAGWLAHSGAEGRLALVLSSGPQATERLLRTLSTTRVEVVRAPSTPARPVHPKLAAHKGDHFNHTLHVVDGFDAGDPAAQLETIDGQRSMLDKMATWVALVVESPASLVALERHAPGVWRAIQRRCVVLHPEMFDAQGPPQDPAVLDRWASDGRVAERVYHYAMHPGEAPEYHAFSRFVRSGYVGFSVGRPQHPEREQLSRLWATTGIPFDLADAGPAAAEAVARHRASGLDAATRAALEVRLIGAPRARLAAGWMLPDHSVFEALRVVQAGACDADAVGALRALVAADEVGPGLRTHAELAIAAAVAGEGDLDACRDALEAAVTHAKRAALEVRFDALEKLAQVCTFTHERGRARELVDALELLAPRLQSPFYAARFRLARGEFLAPLDAHRAKADLDLARTLFAGHGYPKWAT